LRRVVLQEIDRLDDVRIRLPPVLANLEELPGGHLVAALPQQARRPPQQRRPLPRARVPPAWERRQRCRHRRIRLFRSSRRHAPPPPPFPHTPPPPPSPAARPGFPASSRSPALPPRPPITSG